MIFIKSTNVLRLYVSNEFSILTKTNVPKSYKEILMKEKIFPSEFKLSNYWALSSVSGSLLFFHIIRLHIFLRIPNSDSYYNFL